MRCRVSAGFGLVVAVAVAFAAMHEASAQGPGAMNPRMGGSRGAGVGGGVSGSSVPMMGPQRGARQRGAQSLGSAQRQGSSYSGMFGVGAVTGQANGGAILRSSEAIRSQSKTVGGGGAFGGPAVRAR